MSLNRPVLVGVIVTCCLAACGLAVVAHATDDGTPSSQQVAFAQQVSDLLVNEVVAALFKEFDETTPQNVEHGKQAISLIFNDLNREIRCTRIACSVTQISQQTSSIAPTTPDNG